MFGTTFYRKWAKAKGRCTNVNDKKYEQYGGRGIRICERWLEFQNFYKDMYSSYVDHIEKHGEKDTTLDRIDVDGNYEPSNCRWATWKEQNGNKQYSILYDGMCLRHYCIDNNLSYKIVWQRYHRGWTLKDAIETPIVKDRLYDMHEGVFGDFKVIARDYSAKQTKWFCKCLHCGSVFSKYASNLKRGVGIRCKKCCANNIDT